MTMKADWWTVLLITSLAVLFISLDLLASR